MAQKNELAEGATPFAHPAAADLAPHASRVAKAAYEANLDQLVIELESGVSLLAPRRLLEGLAGASAEQLQEIQISPSGLGLHFPAVDADVYVPALLQGVTGSKRWMASDLGQRGGRAKSAKKAQAARDNGRRGGRPKSS